MAPERLLLENESWCSNVESWVSLVSENRSHKVVNGLLVCLSHSSQREVQPLTHFHFDKASDFDGPL